MYMRLLLYYTTGSPEENADGIIPYKPFLFSIAHGVFISSDLHLFIPTEERLMNHEEQVEKMKNITADFLGYTAIKLPDDVIAKLEELRDKEDTPLA